MSDAKVSWKGFGRNCTNGNPFACAAALADGIPCGAGECDVLTGNRKMPPRPKRKGPANQRTRKARWRATLAGVTYVFEYDPAAGMLRIWRHRHHKKRTITNAELLHLLDGQKLLPL